MGEHQAAGSWANADHVGKRGSSLEIHDSGAAKAGYSQELPTHHQKDKATTATDWSGSSFQGFTPRPQTPHPTEDGEAHTQE